MTLEEMTAQHDALLAARFRGMRTVEIDGRRVAYATDAEHIGYEARPAATKHGDERRGHIHGNSLPDKCITLADLIHGKVKGRKSADQITYSGAETSKGRSSMLSPARSMRLRAEPASPRNPDRVVFAGHPELIGVKSAKLPTTVAAMPRQSGV